MRWRCLVFYLRRRRQWQRRLLQKQQQQLRRPAIVEIRAQGADHTRCCRLLVCITECSSSSSRWRRTRSQRAGSLINDTHIRPFMNGVRIINFYTHAHTCTLHNVVVCTFGCLARCRPLDSHNPRHAIATFCSSNHKIESSLLPKLGRTKPPATLSSPPPSPLLLRSFWENQSLHSILNEVRTNDSLDSILNKVTLKHSQVSAHCRAQSAPFARRLPRGFDRGLSYAAE